MTPGPTRLGLIGCGGIVQRVHSHAYGGRDSDVTVVAVADPSETARDSVATTLGVPTSGAYAAYQDMLDAGGMDAVCIATPHHVHAEQAIAAAEAGLDIVSEKPMASTVAEADAILGAVAKAGVWYTVVHNLLSSDAMKRADKVARAEEFGPVTWGRAQSVFRKADGLDASDWRATRAAGGGCAIDTAYHEIYSVEALVGSPVATVEGRVRTVKFDIDVDDLALFLMEHVDGTVSTVTSTWCAPSFGTEGGRWCEAHGAAQSVRVYHREKDPLHVHGAGGWQSALPDGQGDDPTGHLAFLREAFAALRAGDPPPVTGADARRNLSIIEAAREATLTRRGVEVSA
jgi:predicted dehydrogenase